MIPNIDTAAAYTGLYDRAADCSTSATTARVTEDSEGRLSAVRCQGRRCSACAYSLNAGMRYVRVDQSSTGTINGGGVTLEAQL